MRAGLLSDPRIIELVNQKFVATWIIVDDAQRRAKGGDVLAKTLQANWQFPLDIMFISVDGSLLNKLNSFENLRAAHSDVGHPPAGRGRSAPHTDTFLKHVAEHFGL